MKKETGLKKKPPRESDRILIREIEFLANCGVSGRERNALQKFSLDIDLFFDLEKAGKSGNLVATVDYSEVAGLVLKIGKVRPYILLEEMAEEMAGQVLKKFPVMKVRLLLVKSVPPVDAIRGGFGVEIIRGGG